MERRLDVYSETLLEISLVTKGVINGSEDIVWTKSDTWTDGEMYTMIKIYPNPLNFAGGSGGGFFLACEDFGRMFDRSFYACAFLSFLLPFSFFFF